MANEAVCIETPTEFSRRTVADGTAVPIGTIMELEEPNTVTLSDTSGNVFGGIAWEEHTASEGLTEMTVAMNGVWDMKDAGAGVTMGGIVSVGGVNLIKQATEAECVTGTVIGKCEETAEAGEVVRIRVGRVV